MNAPELGPVRWRKSTRSGANGNCVEFAEFGPTVAVRDSKDATGPALLFSADPWRSFIAGTKTGTFDA